MLCLLAFRQVNVPLRDSSHVSSEPMHGAMLLFFGIWTSSSVLMQ